MKLNIKNIGLCAATALALASCSDVVNYQDDIADEFASDGAPVITAIYDIQDTASAPTALSGGVMNEMIRISGNNLSHVKSVTFNGISVEVSQIYAESKNSYLKIPRKIPEVTTDSLIYTTEKGTYSMIFPVNIPHMSLTGLSNEFATAGSRVQITSEYADLFGYADSTSDASIVMTNAESGYSQKLKADSCSDEYFSIKIPKDAPDNSILEFAWTEQGTRYSQKVPYRMAQDLLFGNFDGDLGWWNDWGKGLVTDGTKSGDPASLGYQYLRIKGSFDAWSWNSTGIGLNWPNQDWTDHPENYVMKFEVCSNTSTPFVDYGDNGANGSKNGGYNFDFNASGVTRRQWDPVTAGLRNTYGKWVTQSIPLDELCEVKQDDGSIKHVLGNAGTWMAMEFVLQPNTSDTWTVDHSFGQFRIEPKNY